MVSRLENTNLEFSALMEHPAMNLTNPTASPRPLFFTTDFVRRTYIEYLFPLLPKNSHLKSSKIANPYIFRYGTADRPLPQEPTDAYLEDPSNWPSDLMSAKSKELFTDAVMRSAMIAMGISDPVKGAMMMQGQFDWEKPVDIKAMSNRFL